MASQHVNGSSAMAGSGVVNGQAGDMSVLPKIHEALELIHNPRASNQDRQEAQQFLEHVKNLDEAPSHGYTLASDRSQSPVVRHYALSLLENAIKHKWNKYPEEHQAALRQWVLELASSVSREDPGYLRNKIAQLWVEVAKRSWVEPWMDMDALLVQLWMVPDSAVHKELVLLILETLSDEIFNSDDPAVTAREGLLSRASVEIFTPAAVLLETFPNREAGPEVRCGDEGWLGRITQFLSQCLSGDLQNNDELRSCAVRGFAVLFSLMPWVIPNAATATGCVPTMCQGLRASHIAVQKGALQAMHALYSRTSLVDQEFLDLVVPLYNSQCVELFGQLFQWSTVDAEDIDDDKYQFGKRLSELVSFLGNYLDRRFAVLPKEPDRVDFQGFLRLLLMVAQSQSLVVSIPVLVTWTRLLGHKSLGQSIAELQDFIGPLLELCASRLVRYESLPEDTQDPTFLFLMEDTDTVPERHAFLGNYRRYASTIIELIVQLKLADAVSHVLRQTENVLQNPYDGQPSFDPSKYEKNSPSVLRVDAQATVIEASLRGCLKWRGRDDVKPEDIGSLEDMLEDWATRVLSMSFQDPIIRKRVLQLLVVFSTTALDRKPRFMLKVLEHILMTWPAPQPEYRQYNEAIKDLQTESMLELQRLAAKMPDHLLEVYDQISAKVNDMIASGTMDEKRQITYQTFLFTIIHRCSRLDRDTKIQKLQEFVQPIKSQWRNDKLKEALASYSGFCQMMALDKAQEYLARRRVHEVADWGSMELDDEGKALQAEMEERQTANRFWQAGISEGSKDEFYARVLDKKHTMEGLGSTIRGSIRFVRESVYAILYCMSRLEMEFYGFKELPGPLANALMANSYSLSPHQQINLLNLVRYLVDSCPTNLRDHFLPPLMAASFQQMDAKITSEWEKLETQKGVQAGEAALAEEMKSESILRQLTYTAVMMVADFLDPARMNLPVLTSSEESTRRYPTLRKFCLMNSEIVEPLLVFCTHVIRVRDTRCCSIMLRVFRSIIPDFRTVQEMDMTSDSHGPGTVDNSPIPAATASLIREYISNDVLRACVQSMNEHYFVDLQKEIATFIGAIIANYSPLTNTPKSVLQSIPNLRQEDINEAIEKICSTQNSKLQRNSVLLLFSELKGVSISELGRLGTSVGPLSSARKSHGKKASRSQMAQEFMTPAVNRGANGQAEEGLEGVAGLFGQQ
ncbi:hypothetical protein E8E14_003090 [Neopestalotiopsis sp. 37M]|nr:hypothetical protein E8E14_003090 [Neopestalotiopsis sp. 37M]